MSSSRSPGPYTRALLEVKAMGDVEDFMAQAQMIVPPGVLGVISWPAPAGRQDEIIELVRRWEEGKNRDQFLDHARPADTASHKTERDSHASSGSDSGEEEEEDDAIAGETQARIDAVTDAILVALLKCDRAEEHADQM